MNKFQKFTKNGSRITITWKTRNIQYLFPLEDKNDYRLCGIYEGDCSCGSHYIGETKRNAELRSNEHNNPTKSSELSKHLRSNIIVSHRLSFQILQKVLRPARS